MGIKVTGNSRIDGATAEIAVALRDAGLSGFPYSPQREQVYFDEAMRLRDEIMAGTRELPAPVLPPWRAAVNGTSKRPWFLIRGWGTESDRVPVGQRYHNGPSGKLIRYASSKAAGRAADKLNGAGPEPKLLPATVTPMVLTDDIALNMAASVLDAMGCGLALADSLRKLLPEAEGKVFGKPYQEQTGKWGSPQTQDG